MSGVHIRTYTAGVDLRRPRPMALQGYVAAKYMVPLEIKPRNICSTLPRQGS